MSANDVHKSDSSDCDACSTRLAGRSFSSCDFATKQQFADQLAATLGVQAMPMSLRIINDVAQAANGIFRHPSKPRPTRLLKELQSLVRAAQRANAAPDKIPTYLWPYIGAEDVADVAALCSSPPDLIETVEAAIKTVETSKEISLSSKGGRHRDPRIDHFITILGLIYQRYMNTRPTVSFEPGTGHLVSPFGLFVYEAFALFYPSPAIPEGSIQGALKSRFGHGRPKKKKRKKAPRRSGVVR